MGDIADAIMEGLLCSSCGGYVGDPCGYPRVCVDCTVSRPLYKRTLACKHCKRKFKSEYGLAQHVAAKHPDN